MVTRHAGANARKELRERGGRNHYAALSAMQSNLLGYEYTFCLEDGAVLSAPYDPKQTLVLPASDNTDLPPTEMSVPTVKLDRVKAGEEIVATKSAAKRRRWDEFSFFEEAAKNLKTDDVEKLRQLYEFSLDCADRVKWGTGQQRGTFSVVFELFSPSKSLYTVYSDGNLEFNFAWLQPENQKAVVILDEFAQSLKRLRGFNILSNFKKRFITVRKEYWMLQISEVIHAFQTVREKEQKGRQERAERNPQYFKFWESLIALAEGKTDLHVNLPPSQFEYLNVRKWRQTYLSYVINQHNSRVALYTYRVDIYDELYKHKREIERTFGEKLIWTPREIGKQSRIAYDIAVGGYKDDAEWQTIQTAMIDAMVRLEKALSPFIPKLMYLK
jgi:hypothetical protein